MVAPSKSALAVLFLSILTVVTNAQDGHVTINTTPRQKITSFGASGAWWPNDLIHFPTDQQARLAELLFSKNGLHLSSYRYNMGGDGGSDTKIVTNPGSRVESFLLTNGSYDFSRDHAGVTFLQMAQSYKVPYITFFINAAPSHIADNGQACGWILTDAKIPAFAQYISTVLSYWLNKGIKIRYISPMNEPDNTRADCGQEGMGVLPTTRTGAFSEIKSALTSGSANNVTIIGDETSQIGTEGIPENPFWLSNSAQYLSNIAVHNYDYPSDGTLGAWYDEVKLQTGGDPPPVKFTETCCSTNNGSGPSVFGAQYDPTMANALIVARYVWQFLTIANAESFDWWTAVTNLPCSPKIDGPQCATAINNTAGYNSGLYYIDGNYNITQDFNLYPTKRAFAVKHFSYFIRPGSVRYDLVASFPPGVVGLATKNHGLWNALFINSQTTTQDITIQLPSPKSQIKKITETTPAEDFGNVSPLPSVNATDGTVHFQLPAQSLVSMQFTG